MRTSTMNSVKGPVSPNWAESQCSKSVFILELDDRGRWHVALEHLKEGLASIRLVPGLEGAKGRDRIGNRRLLRLVTGIVSDRMRHGMQGLGDRPQPVEQRAGAFAQLVQAAIDPADVAEQRHELAFDRELAVRLEGCDARHVAERAQPPPGEGTGLLGLLELGLDLGTDSTFGGL